MHSERFRRSLVWSLNHVDEPLTCRRSMLPPSTPAHTIRRGGANDRATEIVCNLGAPFLPEVREETPSRISAQTECD